MDADITHAAPVDGVLRTALDDLHFSLQRALASTFNIESRLPSLTAIEALLERMQERTEAIALLWRDPSAELDEDVHHEPHAGMSQPPVARSA